MIGRGVVGRIATLGLVLALALALAACSDDGDGKSNNSGTAAPSTTTSPQFCTTMRQVLAQYDAALKGLGPAAGNPAQLQAAQQALIGAGNAVAQALRGAPPQISGDAATLVIGLQQQISSAQQGTTAPEFPPNNRDAGNRVESYLDTNCGISSSIVPG